MQSVRVQTASIEQRMSELRTLFEAQSSSPQGDDPRIAALYDAFRDCFEWVSMDDIFTQAFELRPDLNAVHAGGLARQALQKQALRRARELDFPERYTTKEPFIELIEETLDNPHSRREFVRDINTRNIQTNQPERGKSLKLVGQLAADRFAHPLRIVDFGASLNHVLKKLALNVRDIGFEYHPVTARRFMSGPEGQREPVIDTRLSVTLNTLLRAGGLAVGRCVGLDKESIGRPHVTEWVRSSLYPSEFLDPSRLEEFDLIETARVPNAGFRKVDVLDVKDPADLLPDRRSTTPADIAFASAMLYQLTPEQRGTAIQAMRSSVDPENGLIIYQDFARVDSEDPSQLKFSPYFGPYTYRTIAEDVRNPGELQELFIWRTGRCNALALGAGSLCVSGKLRTVEELVDIAVSRQAA